MHLDCHQWVTCEFASRKLGVVSYLAFMLAIGNGLGGVMVMSTVRGLSSALVALMASGLIAVPDRAQAGFHDPGSVLIDSVHNVILPALPAPISDQSASRVPGRRISGGVTTRSGWCGPAGPLRLAVTGWRPKRPRRPVHPVTTPARTSPAPAAPNPTTRCAATLAPARRWAPDRTSCRVS